MAKKAKSKKSKFAKGWATRRANARKLGVSPHAFAAAGDTADRRDAINEAARSGQSPGHGEIVGGADAKLADVLVKLARSKGGADKIQNEIARIRSQARYEGESAQDKAHTKRLVDVQQKMADAVVCGFIAEVDAAQRFYQGLPKEMVWSLSSFAVLRVVDALNAAGYTSKGRRET